MTREEIVEEIENAVGLIKQNGKDWLDERDIPLLESVIEALKKKQKWIPVSERLPKGYERVLVTRRMFHWANEPVEYTVGIESFSGNVDFVAWMPLPEPYKGGDAEWLN